MYPSTLTSLETSEGALPELRIVVPQAEVADFLQKTQQAQLLPYSFSRGLMEKAGLPTEHFPAGASLGISWRFEEQRLAGGCQTWLTKDEVQALYEAVAMAGMVRLTLVTAETGAVVAAGDLTDLTLDLIGLTGPLDQALETGTQLKALHDLLDPLFVEGAPSEYSGPNALYGQFLRLAFQDHVRAEKAYRTEVQHEIARSGRGGPFTAVALAGLSFNYQDLHKPGPAKAAAQLALLYQPDCFQAWLALGALQEGELVEQHWQALAQAHRLLPQSEDVLGLAHLAGEPEVLNPAQAEAKLADLASQLPSSAELVERWNLNEGQLMVKLGLMEVEEETPESATGTAKVSPILVWALVAIVAAVGLFLLFPGK